MTFHDVTGAVPAMLTYSPGVRHDLRHVLATLQALVTAADAEPCPDPDRVRTLLATARREAGLALDLLDALPEAHLDAGADPPAVAGGGDAPARQVCEVRAVLREAAAAAVPSGRSVTVEAPAPLHVAVSRTALTRIVRNLLWNALAATSPGGAVLLQASEVGPGRGERSRHGILPGTVRLECHDDGPGPGPGGFRRRAGTGLMVVRSVVLPAGGWVVLGRSPLGGSCAAVSLPVASVGT